MYTPNTFQLKENQFVDTYGFFTLTEKKSFIYHVAKNMKYGKIGKYSGFRVKLSLIYTSHYGHIIEMESTQLSANQKIKKIDLVEFNKRQKKFSEFDSWTSEKRTEGVQYFNFLRKHNPIYIQKHKDWIKQFDSESKIGDYITIKITKRTGKLKSLIGLDCIFVVTYNSGFKNGFMVLPLI